VKNDSQNHGVHRCCDPDFPLCALDLFPTNDADQRKSQGVQKAGQLGSLDIFVPYCVSCSRRHSQIGLDLVVGALNAKPPDARS
jgi:hypothetical protein